MQHKTYTIRDIQFWKISLSLGLASFFTFASLYSLQPLLPVFVKEFSITASQSSLALSLSTVGLILGLIILGFMSDRKGRTIFIKLSLIGSIIPFLLIPMTDSFLILLILRLIQGFMLSGLPAASLAYLAEEIDRRDVSIAITLYIASNALGGMLGRVIAGYITDHYSWEMAFYFLAIVGVVILVMVLLMLPKSRFFKSSNLSFSRDIEGFLFHLKNPKLLLVFGLGIILQFSFTGMWTYLPFHLQEPPYSLSIQSISYMFFAYGFGVIGSPIAGWLAGKWSLEKIRVAGIIIMSVGILLTLSASLLTIIIGLSVACLGFFTAHSLTASSVSGKATHHKGSASSLYLVAYYIGVAGGSSAFGPLWSAVGWIGLIIVAGMIPLLYLGFIKIVSRRFHKKRLDGN